MRNALNPNPPKAPATAQSTHPPIALVPEGEVQCFVSPELHFAGQRLVPPQGGFSFFFFCRSGGGVVRTTTRGSGLKFPAVSREAEGTAALADLHHSDSFVLGSFAAGPRFWNFNFQPWKTWRHRGLPLSFCYGVYVGLSLFLELPDQPFIRQS